MDTNVFVFLFWVDGSTDAVETAYPMLKLGKKREFRVTVGHRGSFFGIDFVFTVHRLVECSEYSNVYCDQVGILTGLTTGVLRPLPAV